MAEERNEKLDGGGSPHPQYRYSPRYWRKRILKSGGSLYVNLPFPILRDLGLSHHGEVLVYLVGRVICIQPASIEEFWPEVVSVRSQKSEARSQERNGDAA